MGFKAVTKAFLGLFCNFLHNLSLLYIEKRYSLYIILKFELAAKYCDILNAHEDAVKSHVAIEC